MNFDVIFDKIKLQYITCRKIGMIYKIQGENLWNLV